jgi:low affinity Fe/Cu permease
MSTKTLKENIFSALAHKITHVLGSYATFKLSAVFVVAWFLAGPFMGFSAEWQAIITSVTAVVTFFMVIFIQHAQNHATKALHLKLDELIRATDRARNKLVELEKLTDEELDTLQKEFGYVREEALRREERRKMTMADARPEHLLEWADRQPS